MNKVQIYYGNPDANGFHPFAIIRLPHYSNKPAYSKFANFLKKRVDRLVPCSTCSLDVNALEVIDKSVSINLEKCIGCLACLASVRNPYNLLSLEMREILSAIILDYSLLEKRIHDLDIFKGAIFNIPKRPMLPNAVTNFNEFTSQKELEHLASWATVVFGFLSSDEGTWIGKEIQLENPVSPRDNRLDVCCVSDNKVFVGETKVSLDSLLTEDRYGTQIPSYVKSCNRLVQEHNVKYADNKSVYIYLLVGGSETDLLPPGHPQSTSQIGNKGKRFYRTIASKDIKFISANAIWLMTFYSLVTRKRLCWDKLLLTLFNSRNAVGLLTCGTVSIKDGQANVEAIPSTILKEAEQAFV